MEEEDDTTCSTVFMGRWIGGAAGIIIGSCATVVDGGRSKADEVDDDGPK